MYKKYSPTSNSQGSILWCTLKDYVHVHKWKAIGMKIICDIGGEFISLMADCLGALHCPE